MAGADRGRAAGARAVSGARLVLAAAGRPRALSQPLGALVVFLLTVALALPAGAADTWRPLLVDGERLPGPGVWVRGSHSLFPVVLLGRRLRCTVGVNRVAGVLVVQGREIPAEISQRDGVVFVSQEVVKAAFPQLVVEEDGLAVQVWSTAPRPTGASDGLRILGTTPVVVAGRLRLDVEVGNPHPREARGGVLTVAFLEEDGRTYAEFREAVEPLDSGDRRVVPVQVWLTPLRLLAGDRLEVELHGLAGGRVERRTLRWQVVAR